MDSGPCPASLQTKTEPVLHDMKNKLQFTGRSAHKMKLPILVTNMQSKFYSFDFDYYVWKQI